MSVLPSLLTPLTWLADTIDPFQPRPDSDYFDSTLIRPLFLFPCNRKRFLFVYLYFYCSGLRMWTRSLFFFKVIAQIGLDWIDSGCGTNTVGGRGTTYSLSVYQSHFLYIYIVVKI